MLTISDKRTSGASERQSAIPDIPLAPAAASLISNFRSPPVAFGPVPFYWWAGDPLSQERLTWQLDHLKAQGVNQVIISYPHGPDALTELGDPPLFSTKWWELFRWFLAQCRNRGMSAGFQDYTLVGNVLQKIGLATPDMQGGQMSSVSSVATDQQEVKLQVEPGTLAIAAWAYPIRLGAACPEEALDLTPELNDGNLHWKAMSGDWLVTLVFARLNAFDAMHPDSGKLAVEKLYASFERECPGEVGRTLNIFFQDELDFGSRMPFWSNRLRQTFQARHGYDLWPWLPALWQNLGQLTPKIRLDYADAVVSCMEVSYFEPVFLWHEEHGTLFGNDNFGRGEARRGRNHYGDYFRTMRWFSAPGCDDPKVHGKRAFKGIKVNSSIAHLYCRPRVWTEALHSSGWGTTPAEVVAAINENFAYGTTVVSLHGLYYSTHGSWWEWASPDFHFRQPYWEHFAPVNDYFTRVSWLLSQGVHRCDVALLYPSSAIEVEAAVTERPQLHAHVGDSDIEDKVEDSTDAEVVAFGLGKFLFDRACDFDFIDFESLARAKAVNAELQVSGEVYRVLILPAMSAIRFSTLKAALDFVRAGGLVIAYGCLPTASERAGACDPQFDALLAEIFSPKPQPSGGRGIFVRQDYNEVLRHINDLIPRDIETSDGPLQVLHRRLDAQDVFYVFNPAKSRITCDVHFRVSGEAEHWDAWTAAVTSIPTVADNGVSTLRLTLAAGEAKIIVFHRDAAPQVPVNQLSPAPVEIELIDGLWNFMLRPTMDNRFGDFRLPATVDYLGPDARRFRWTEEFASNMAWHEAAFDDSAWPETTYSFGPRFEVLGPLAPDAECVGQWRPYEYSLRWGVERDPFLTNWLSGPHGLKNQVPDEFLDFHSDTPGSAWYLRAQVIAEASCEVPLLMGGRCAYQAWVNGELTLEQVTPIKPGRYAPWNIAHYECMPRETRVQLRSGINHLQLKLIQPEGQRTRAFIAFAPPRRDPNYLGLRWYSDSAVPRPALLATPDRRAVWLRCLAPPGLRELQFVARGNTRVWANGQEMAIKKIEKLPDGSHRYIVSAENAHPRSVPVAFRIEAAQEYRAGDVLPEPVRFECGAGQLPLGDWRTHGLAVYSGIGEYQRSFEWTRDRRLVLDLGNVAATAEVLVNGKLAGRLVVPPWRVDVTELIRNGQNDVVIRVANTLANHYSIGIPTPFLFPAQARSGLIGPLRLLQYEK
jgi:hypothetical protein